MPPSIFTDPTFLIVSSLALIGLGALFAQNIRRVLLYLRWIFIGRRCFGRVQTLESFVRNFKADEASRAPGKESDNV